MIEKNLGNIERLFRLMLATGLALWTFTQPHLNGVEWFTLVVAALLILNGIFSRCYLWYVLDLSTNDAQESRCTHNGI